MAASDKKPQESPHESPRGWRDVFNEIDYSRYAQQPYDNVYVWG